METASSNFLGENGEFCDEEETEKSFGYRRGCMRQAASSNKDISYRYCRVHRDRRQGLSCHVRDLVDELCKETPRHAENQEAFVCLNYPVAIVKAMARTAPRNSSHCKKRR